MNTSIKAVNTRMGMVMLGLLTAVIVTDNQKQGAEWTMDSRVGCVKHKQERLLGMKCMQL